MKIFSVKNALLGLILSGALAAFLSSARAQEQANIERDGNRVVVSVPLVPASSKPIETGLADVIRAKYPLSVAFSDLGAGWRDLVFRDQRYFTKGETVIVSENEYLIAYVYDSAAPDSRDAAAKAAGATGEKEAIATLTGQSVSSNGYFPGDRFALTLLSLRDVLPYLSNGQIGLHSFNPAAYRTTSKFDPPLDNPGYRQQLALVYLRKISEAANAYSNAYLDVLPPTETAFAARQALFSFAGNGYVFNVPGTDQPFKVNPIFSGKKRAHLRSRRKSVFYYQDAPAEDGLRAVLLLDGTTLRLDEKGWEKYKRRSDIE